ncbi:endothelial cell-specific molecule 1 [Brachyhypopomus gauderio]|uniref:endothelial cell-specific molecule 1 n=1 Tax=Brachyhypopomus gauderio TaxID=698409 RepID=UPI0040412078
MHLLLITVILALELREAESWSASVKYAVNCPGRCELALCGSTQRCSRTVLDDCGCCQVCAAGRGEHCYRTVSGMHGVKCGPGLYCDFYKDEDDYGDEYGVCKDCMYGTYGLECRKTCTCKAGGLCDRETGACLSFKLLAKLGSKLHAHEGEDVSSGDGAPRNRSAVSQKERRENPKGLLPPR